ncbi:MULTISPECIES: hypothetical protein [unclassified Moorena]|uniref:hypothetical protein n=1 Tax=unclassified Moorena TaxID=2683338 RepID=UPI0013CDB972|nr:MULTISPECIES: hypothetical protein [unclassified Moorena]NEO19648.1 hypothetical protein [Moorena sp. SIO4A5]NEQ59184.1 hypothetical protein [Moorena sp. SIO4A1]
MKLARCQFHARCPFYKTLKIIPLLSKAKFYSLLPTPYSLLPLLLITIKKIRSSSG